MAQKYHTGIFGLDDVYAGGGLHGIATPAPQPKKPASTVPYYSGRHHTAVGYLNLRKDAQTPLDRVFNDAYRQAHDQKIHLGSNIFEIFKPGDYLPKPEKRTRNLGMDYNTGKMRTEEYWHTHDFTPEDAQAWRDTIYNAVRQGEQDGREFREKNKIEADTWAQQDKEAADIADQKSRADALAAAWARNQRELEEKVRYQSAYNAASQARQLAQANAGNKRFAKDPAAAYGSGSSGGASQKMVSHKGLDNDVLLGGKGKLGVKTLLGA